MKCKICDLQERKIDAYNAINESIKQKKAGKKISLSQVARDLNEQFDLNITPNNITRHAPHIKSNTPKKTRTKPKTSKPGRQPKPEIPQVEVISKQGELIYSNIDEIKRSLEQKQIEFCEARAFKYQAKATPAYMDVYGVTNYNAAAASASQLLKNPNILAYARHCEKLAVEASGLTPEYVVMRLKENLDMCMQAEPKLDRQGNETGYYVHNAQGANKAAEILLKYMGFDSDGGAVEKNRKVYEEILGNLAATQSNPFIKSAIELAMKGLPIPEALKQGMRKADPKQLSILPKENFEEKDYTKMTPDELAAEKERLKRIINAD